MYELSKNKEIREKNQWIIKIIEKFIELLEK
jgi:hypothetical protein